MSTVNRSLFFQIWQHKHHVYQCVLPQRVERVQLDKSWFITVFDSLRGNIVTMFSEACYVCNFFWLFEKEGGCNMSQSASLIFFSVAEWIIFNAYTLSIFWPTITILAMMRVYVCPDALENHEMFYIPFWSVTGEINKYTK